MGGMMDGTRRQRRGDTRQRIQDEALELFAEHGYEKTSLREIAERLNVTKAAVYYHFRTKEEILVSIFEDFSHPIEELIAWGKRQRSSLETKQEILRRYGDMLASAAPFFRFMQDNGAAVKELRIGEMFRSRMHDLRDIIIDSEALLVDQVRCVSALFALHAGVFVLEELDGDPEVKHKAILKVATDLVVQAHGAQQVPSPSHSVAVPCSCERTVPVSG
ncbi:TetR/AcrR family transcriptional regulator [Streptomyces mirabilis]|uniref:TetR/AcrR family transcriptional regulator n=1 Tax=Streptomyces mirabilis TaxID=68239 RepID=UPI00367775DA